MSLQLAEGSVFATRYRVVRCIAHGGMGAVYEVEHMETLRHVALKVMLPHIVQSAEMRDRFRREARVAAHVESDHIVTVLDAGIDDATGSPFLVMELLRGEELSKALARRGRFAPEEVVTYLHQTALALERTHRAFIVHRDLKPDNLFLTLREDGQARIKVLDFGIAKLAAEGTTQDPSTRSVGTPLYMAPEQFRSAGSITPATDVYALGMIAYTLLVGSSYWAPEASNSANVFAFAGSVTAGPREPASVRARSRGVILPEAFDPWFARITALSPEERFSGALAAVEALADALGTSRPGGVLVPATTPPSPLSAEDPDGTDAAATIVYTPPNRTVDLATSSGAATPSPAGGTNPTSAAVGLSSASPHLTQSEGALHALGSASVVTGAEGFGLAATGGADASRRPRGLQRIATAALAGALLGSAALLALIAFHPQPRPILRAIAPGDTAAAVAPEGAVTTATLQPTPVIASPNVAPSLSANPVESSSSSVATGSVSSTQSPTRSSASNVRTPQGNAGAARKQPKTTVPSGSGSLYVRD
jgi:serine/threonine-protein kinase